MSRLPECLESARLQLRLPVPEEDTGALNFAIAKSQNELERWMDWAVQPQTMEETRSFCRQSREAWQSETAFNALMIEKVSGEIVGSAGYPRLDWSVPRFEIGYWCRSDRTGRGYVSEATWLLAAHAFGVLGANRVELRMDDLNHRSWRVAERLGFTREATLRNEVRVPDGSLRTTRIYAAVSLAELRAPVAGR